MEKILICSADESFREIAKEALGNKHNLILCEDINQCPEIISNTQIQQVILDIENQENLNDRITDLASKPLRITIVANHKSREKAEEAVLLGASGYLVKPLKPEAMLSCIK